MNKDKKYLLGILELEKNISNSYNIFLNKSSNDYLYENIFSMLEDSNDMSREIYNLMYRLGLIEIEEVNNNFLLKNIDKFEDLIKNI